jgi:hypothetical protein
MRRAIPMVLGVVAMTAMAFAQTTESPERAVAAAPRQLREGATVIKWKADNTYDTVKKGTNRLVCYDRSGEPGRAAFAVQCTSVGNLERVAQNRKFEAIADKTERQKQLDAAEANGTRVKPEYGSVWYDMNGADQEHARIHTTIAVPGATTQSTGLPDNPKQGGVWIMDAGTTTAHIMTPGS